MTPADAPPQYLTERVIRVTHPEIRPGAETSSPAEFKVFRFHLQQPAAGWLKSAVARIEGLTSLARNWDSYGARPVSAEAAVAAVRFLLDAAYSELAAPSIVPIPDGGIQLEWHRGGLDLEIAFSEEEPGTYLDDRDSGSSYQGSLAEAASLLTRLMPRLRD